MPKFMLLLAGLFVFTFGTGIVGDVSAQPQCDQRDTVLQILSDKYKEAPVALGVTHNGGLVEVLASAHGESWSIIVTTPQGLSCLVAAGEGWHAMQQVSTDPAI